ncbi:MAG: hypothetical protein ACXWZR_00690 [Mycobacterium sp.]
MTAAQIWRTTLREALVAARKERNATRISALRSAERDRQCGDP